MWSDWLKSWKSKRSVWSPPRKSDGNSRRSKQPGHWLQRQVEELEARSLLTQITVTSLADVVADDGQVTLREAVTAANEDRSVDGSEAGSGADEIVFAESLVQDSAVIVLKEGEIAINSDLTIRGPGSEQLSIDGGGVSHIFRVGQETSRVFDWNHTPDSLHVGLTGLTLTNGRDNNYGNGGDVLNFESLSIIDCTINGSSNGAIVNYGAMSLTDCRVQGSSYGPGIRNFGDLKLNESAIRGNADGGIENIGTLTMNSCVVADNTNWSGGGLNNSGKAKIRDSLFTGNRSTWVGGAISNSGELTISETTIANNTAVANGGIRNDDGKLTIDHCTITGNVADLRSGGIRNFHYQGGTGFVRLTNSIVAGNTLSDGTPAEVFGNSLDLANSRNNLIGDPASSGGLVNGTRGNIVGASDSSGGRTMLNLATVLFPDFVDDGGLVQSMPFVPGSPVKGIGASVHPLSGDSAKLVAVSVARPQVTEDGSDELEFRFSRLNTAGPLTVSYSIGGAATLGDDYVVDGADASTNSIRTVTFADGQAVASVRFNPTADDQVEPSESVVVNLLSGDGYSVSSEDTATGLIAFDETLVVNTLADESNKNPFDGTMTLRDAIDLANRTIGPNTIEFASSLTASGPATIALTDDSLSIDSDVSIIGPGADLLTIKGRWQGLYVPYWSTHVLEVSGLTLTANGIALLNEGTTILDNVTLNGSQTGAENSGMLTLNHSTVTGNDMGLANRSSLTTSNCLPTAGKLTINQSVVTDNVLGVSNEGALVVRQSSITDNGLRREQGAVRGGIWNHSYSEEGSNVVWARATVEIDDSEITENVGPRNRVANIFGNGLKRVVSHPSPARGDASNGSPSDGLPIDNSTIAQSGWEEMFDDPELSGPENADDPNLQAGTGSDTASSDDVSSTSDKDESSDSSVDATSFAENDTQQSDESSDSGDAGLGGSLNQAFVEGIVLPIASDTNSSSDEDVPVV